jgi:hypothetical protein
MWPFRRRLIPRAEVIEIRPGDRIILEWRERLTRDMIDAVREQASKAFGVEVNRVIVVQNATVKVLRAGDPPPPPVIVAPGRY